MKKFLDAATKLDLPARDVKNANVVNIWMLGWALTLIGATAVAEFAEDSDYFVMAMMLSIALHIAVTVGMILKYKHLLSLLDELEKKIQFDALALSVGVALGGCSVYSILENANFVDRVEINVIIMLIAFTYSIALIAGRIRYR